MKKTFGVLLIATAVAISFYSFSTGNRGKKTPVAIKYTCLPCGAGCDTMVYDKPGTCSHCNMKLIDRSTIVHKNIQPGQLCSLDNKKIIFLDVRTAEEFNGTAEDKFGAIKNAINIQYKDKEIIVYCSHSHRSPRASYMLTQNGFKHVTNMLGGMSVWKDLVKKHDCNERLYQWQ